MKSFSTHLPVGIALLVSAFSIQSFAQTNNPSPMPSASGSPNPTTSTTPSVPTTPTAPTVPSTSLNIQTVTGPMGTYLADESGRSLYIYASDTQGKSNCVDACAQAWPPLTVPNGQTAHASGGVMSNLLGTIVRSDGSTQVTYNGFPLYYYGADLKPHDVTGQGIMQFGGMWNLIKPDGSKI